LSKQKAFRFVLAAAVAAVVSVPLISQVKKAQSAANQPAELPAAVTAAPVPDAVPTTKPVEVDPAKIILTQGNVTVTAGEFNSVVEALPPQYQAAAVSDPSVKKRIAERVLQVKLIAAEAKRRGLQDKPSVKQQIDMKVDELLVNVLAKDLQTSGNEKEAREYFDANKSNFDNVKARHILIRTPGSPVPVEGKELTEAEAKAKADQIEQRLAKGEDFSAIAKTESADKSSGLKGGDLGTFSPWRMDGDFSKAALGLKKNQISEPVKTQFGYHIIQLLDDTPRTYDEAKGEIGEARWGQLVNSLKDQGKPEYDPAFFGGAATVDAPPATQPAARVP
jgi:peptidyl-prolyl cis-trans isomerase C